VTTTLPDTLLASAEDEAPASDLFAEGEDVSWRSFDGARVLRFRASGLLAKGTSWRGAYFDEPDFSGACFISAVLDRSFMFEAALGGADFTNASLRGVEWLSCLAPGARFDEADLTGSKLDATIFPQASLRGARLVDTSLVGCSFRGCDLTGADFTGADLTDVILEGAVLRDAVFD